MQTGRQADAMGGQIQTSRQVDADRQADATGRQIQTGRQM